MREPIITASEWDPGPSESEEERPVAGDGKRLCSILFGDHKALAVDWKQQDVEPNFRTPARKMTGTTFKQLDGKPLYLWPPEPRTQLALRNSKAQLMALMNARLEQQYQLTLGSAAPAVEASHISPMIGTGMQQATEHQTKAQNIQDQGCKAGDGNKAFWHLVSGNYSSRGRARWLKDRKRFGNWSGFLWKMGSSQGVGIEGRQIWDPGGEEEKFLVAVGRCG